MFRKEPRARGIHVVPILLCRDILITRHVGCGVFEKVLQAGPTDCHLSP